MAKEVPATQRSHRIVRIGHSLLSSAAPCFAALCLAMAGMGCEESPSPSGSTTAPATTAPADRWTRRMLPRSNEWIPQSEAPTTPQSSPAMTIWEVSRYAPGTQPSQEQRQAASDLVERCYQAAERHGWFDIEQGKADGFEYLKTDGRHFRNREFHLDDRVLDPDRPETLMYYPMPNGEYALAGFMFFVKAHGDWGPQIGGPLTIWHSHIFTTKRCYVGGLWGVGFAEDGACEIGEGHTRSAEMMHVWLIDHPRGPFATGMMLPPGVVAEKVALRKRERGF